jgi:hypothetical protein
MSYPESPGDDADELQYIPSRLLETPLPCQFLKDGKPADEIVAAAREWSAEAALRHGPCLVMVVKAGAQ